MQYRSIKKANVSVSALGLGCMRLPQEGNRIDRQKALHMMRIAAERGINYFDSAYVYHSGESELVIGEALKEIGRDKIFVATKLPCWLVEKKEDFERLLDEQLKKLGTDRIDFYLLHGLSANTWEKMQELDALSFLDKAVEKGKIRFPGFSHHDSTENFIKIIDSYEKWTVAQIILNYLDDQYQAGLSGSLYAMEKGVNTVVMEPLKGGMLSANAPESVSALFRGKDPDISLTEWALRWIYSIPQVSCALSGMSNMNQLEENLDSYDKFGRLESIELSESEKRLFDAAKFAFLQHSGVRCTACRYCMPCPADVDIPGVFGNYNIIKMFDNADQAKMRYARLIYSGTSGDKCVECGRCEGLCPQHLPIIGLLKEAHEAMR